MGLGVSIIAICAVATVATGGACGFAYAIASNALKGAIWGAVQGAIGGETYTTTPEHPFYVEGKDFVNASELEVGDKVVCYDTETDTTETKEVEEVYSYETDEPVTVYNFEVHEYHTYHVGEDGVLVHNDCKNPGKSNSGGGSSSTARNNARYSREGYQSNGRSNNLLGRDRSTGQTVNSTEWRRSISRQNIGNERKLFLGDDYVKVDAGKWRSLDGTRQFRVKPGDYLGNHGIGQPIVPNTPHVHFEFLTPRSGGNGFNVIKNIHVPLVD